jgi:hypothetical protein
VGVEKLAVQKFTEIASRQDALQTTFFVRLDIFYPPNFFRFLKYRVFQQPRLLRTVIYTFAVIPQIIFDMTTCSTFRVAIAFCTLLPPGAVAQKPETEAPNVSEAEYEIFSAYINSSFVGATGTKRVGMPISQIVIVSSTESDKDDLDDRFDPDDVPPGGIEKYLRTEATSLRAATVSNFHQANKKQADLALRFHIGLPYQLVSAKQIGSILKDVSDWPKYYTAYPGSQGHVALSRVGFSSDGKQALLYASNWCGGKCATGSYVVMEKHGSAWKVVKEVFMWMS